MADSDAPPAYRRVLLKLSGEALAGHLGYGIDPETIGRIAEEISGVVALRVQVAVVIGAVRWRRRRAPSHAVRLDRPGASPA